MMKRILFWGLLIILITPVFSQTKCDIKTADNNLTLGNTSGRLKSVVYTSKGDIDIVTEYEFSYNSSKQLDQIKITPKQTVRGEQPAFTVKFEYKGTLLAKKIQETQTTEYTYNAQNKITQIKISGKDAKTNIKYYYGADNNLSAVVVTDQSLVAEDSRNEKKDSFCYAGYNSGLPQKCLVFQKTSFPEAYTLLDSYEMTVKNCCFSSIKLKTSSETVSTTDITNSSEYNIPAALKGVAGFGISTFEYDSFDSGNYLPDNFFISSMLSKSVTKSGGLTENAVTDKITKDASGNITSLHYKTENDLPYESGGLEDDTWVLTWE